MHPIFGRGPTPTTCPILLLAGLLHTPLNTICRNFHIILPIQSAFSSLCLWNINAMKKFYCVYKSFNEISNVRKKLSTALGLSKSTDSEGPAEDEMGFFIYFQTAFLVFELILTSCSREVGRRRECRTCRGIPNVQTIAIGALTAADIFSNFTSTEFFYTNNEKLPPGNATMQSMEHM